MVGEAKVATRHSYKTYLKLNTKTNPVSLTIYCNILNEFFKFIMGLILDGEHVKLPYRTGSILITGCKTKPRIDENGDIKGLSPDWVKTKALWNKDPEAKKLKKIIYNFNEHTHGVRYKITWVKKGINILNNDLYSLIFSRTNKRDVMTKIYEGKEYYVTHTVQ